jgi:hypothetical protein
MHQSKKMKPYLLSFCLLLLCSTCFCQWSDTTNQFYDSLAMPVAVTTNDQINSLVIKSAVDESYFVVWEDNRNAGTNLYDIYAQKYDKSGKALWPVNGVPVATGSTNQQYSTTKNGYSGDNDYRNVSHAASDGAGGFYIAYADLVRLGSHDFSRVCVQHVLSTGSVVFGDTGFVIGDPSELANTEYSSPQLVEDGKGGFFIGYARGKLQQSQSIMSVQMFCYKDEGGTLKRYGGGTMNESGLQRSTPAPCGARLYLDPVDPSFATGFFMFSDLQGGAGVIMMEQLQNVQVNVIAFNRLCRVKKDCHTVVYRRFSDKIATTRFDYDYKKDSVVRLYSFTTYNYEVSCRPSNNPDVIVVYTNTEIENGGDGYFSISNRHLYGVWEPNAVMMPTDGNVDVCLATWNQRDFNSATNSLSNWYTRSISFRMEKYDSVPYELGSNTDFPYFAYRPFPPGGLVLDKLNTDGLGQVDTLLQTQSTSQYEYTLAASGNRALLATNSISAQNATQFPIYYQELKLSRVSADSFAMNLATPTQSGIQLGAGQTATRYLYPQFATDGDGHALFYMSELGKYIHVSPVEPGGKLSWGSLGLPLSAAVVNGSTIYTEAPFAVMGNDGKAVIAWQDQRRTSSGFIGQNIYLRHLDSLTIPGYKPALRKVQSLGANTTIGVPQILNGSSNAWTSLFTVVNKPGVGVVDYSPVAQIKDDYDLGVVSVQTYQNPGVTRLTPAGKPYLNRNYTISVTNHPTGANISIRLIFTKAEFEALKAADPSIQTPGDLSVIKQSNPGGTVPAVYSPVAGEQGIQPLTWAAIDSSGYYIELTISDFSNFFITKSQAALPLTWLNVAAERINSSEASVSWQVAQELNTKIYNVQYSYTGRDFLNTCSVAAKGLTTTTNYQCVVPADATRTMYFRVQEVDQDGRVYYSKVVLLAGDAQPQIRLSPNPARDFVTLQLPANNTVKTVALLNGVGAVIWKMPAGTIGSTVRIPLTSAPGAFYVKVTDDTGVRVFKLIKGF